MSEPIDIDCPRCATENREPQGGQEPSLGYIWWEDASEAEQKAAGEPDSEGEIKCPLCHGSTATTDVAYNAWQASLRPPVFNLGWDANLPDAPKPGLKFEWTDDDHADVIATLNGQPYRIGILAFDADSWCFTRIAPSNVQIDGADTIECDHDAEMAFRKEDENMILTSENPTALAAKRAASKPLRQLYRDDSRELAESGAAIIARKWWRVFYQSCEELHDL